MYSDRGPCPGGAHNLNETQNVHTGHKHGERGIVEGHRWSGSHGLGRTACSSIVLLAVFVGEGEESRAQSRMALQKAVESRRDLQRAVVLGTGRERRISQYSRE